MKAKDLYKKLAPIYNASKKKSSDVLFRLRNDGKLGSVRSVFFEDNCLVLSAAPYSWETFECCTNQDVIDSLIHSSGAEVLLKLDGKVSPIVDIFSDYLPENEDDEGYNFVTFVGD